MLLVTKNHRESPPQTFSISKLGATNVTLAARQRYHRSMSHPPDSVPLAPAYAQAATPAEQPLPQPMGIVTAASPEQVLWELASDNPRDMAKGGTPLLAAARSSELAQRLAQANEEIASLRQDALKADRVAQARIDKLRDEREELKTTMSALREHVGGKTWITTVSLISSLIGTAVASMGLDMIRTSASVTWPGIFLFCTGLLMNCLQILNLRKPKLK